MDLLIYLGVFVAISALVVGIVILKRKGIIKDDEVEGARFLSQMIFFVLQNVNITDQKIKDNISKILTYVLEVMTMMIEINPYAEEEELKQLVFTKLNQVLKNEGFELNSELELIVNQSVDFVLEHYIN